MWIITGSTTRVRRYAFNDKKRYYSAPRVYVHPAGETIFENLLARHTRPYMEWKPVVIKQVASMLGTAYFDVKPMRWSKFAGCSCPCSPGFILPAGMRINTLALPLSKVPADASVFETHFDIWLDVMWVDRVSQYTQTELILEPIMLAGKFLLSDVESRLPYSREMTTEEVNVLRAAPVVSIDVPEESLADRYIALAAR